jgi:hypothetical protein
MPSTDAMAIGLGALLAALTGSCAAAGSLAHDLAWQADPFCTCTPSSLALQLLSQCHAACACRTRERWGSHLMTMQHCLHCLDYHNEHGFLVRQDSLAHLFLTPLKSPVKDISYQALLVWLAWQAQRDLAHTSKVWLDDQGDRGCTYFCHSNLT